MRKRELEALCAKWRRRLRIVDWRLTVRRAFIAGWPDVDGGNDYEGFTRVATITIDPRAPDPERTLVHELVHMTVSPIAPPDTPEAVEEPVVWAITDALLETDRRTG